jgi:hypothetical protein
MLIRNALIMFFCFSMSVSAYSMRCGDQLIYTGDPSFTIVQKCGEPKDKQSYEEVIPLYNGAGYQVGTTVNVIERWIYQRSPADFQYTLTFDGGVLKSIDANRNPY